VLALSARIKTTKPETPTEFLCIHREVADQVTG
jgi:hypothetical protein